MIYFRSSLYFLFLLCSSGFFGLLILLSSRLLSLTGLNRLARVWANSNLVALRAVCGLSIRVSGQGFLNRPNSIVLCKHQSAWETVALRAMLPVEQTWVLKKELTHIPIFGWALKCLSPIAIDRSAGARSIKMLLREGRAALDVGSWVVIFPEGTRVQAGEQATYNIGGALLAERSGFAVIPIAHNAGEFWPRRSIAKTPGVIDLVIGPAILPQGRSAKEINQIVQQWIEDTVQRLPTRSHIDH